MEDGATCKRIMSVQVNKYNENRPHCTVNECNSPMWDILNVAQRLNLLDNCLNMIMNGHKYPQKTQNKIFWEKAWALEDEEVQIVKGQLCREKLLLRVLDKSYYLTWWVMTDISRVNIDRYETMARLACDTNLLKSCNLRYKRSTLASRMCYECNLGIEEDVNHIVM